MSTTHETPGATEPTSDSAAEPTSRRAANRPSTTVPDDETPAGRCPYCDRPLTSEQLLALHVVEAHPEAATPAEQEAYEEAVGSESDALFLYHLKVVGGLVTLWAAFVIAYMVVLGLRG